MVKHLRLDQQAGLVLNTLFNSPVVPTRAEATNAEGKLELGKIYKHHNPGEKPMPGPLPGMTVSKMCIRDRGSADGCSWHGPDLPWAADRPPQP